MLLNSILVIGLFSIILYLRYLVLTIGINKPEDSIENIEQLKSLYASGEKLEGITVENRKS